MSIKIISKSGIGINIAYVSIDGEEVFKYELVFLSLPFVDQCHDTCFLKQKTEKHLAVD